VRAIDAIAYGGVLSGDAKAQATQFSSASGLKGVELAKFAKKIRITGLVGNLRQNKQQLSLILV